MSKLNIQIYASKKVHASFKLLQDLQPINLYITDWSFSPFKTIKNIYRMRKYDVIYFHSPVNLRFFLLLVASLLKKPIILQWIGSDVLIVTWKKIPPFWDIGQEKHITVSDALLSGLPFLTKLFIRTIMKFSATFIDILNKSVTHHIACAQKHIPLLNSVGISAEYQPVLIHIQPDILPFPDDFSVLGYIGFHKNYDYHNFYGWSSLLRLAKDFPDLKIYVLGNNPDLSNYPSNIIFMGFLNNIKSILEKVKAIVRLTYHDGTPRMILEALATGRYVIYSDNFPCTIRAKNYEDLKRGIIKIRQTDSPNYAGFQHILDHFELHEVSGQFVNAFNIARQ